MRAKKRLGQHFLIRPDIAERTAMSLRQVQGVETILEVGPGKGMLTQFLLRHPHDLYLVEADQDMIPVLKARFPAFEHERIITADFLKMALAMTR